MYARSRRILVHVVFSIPMRNLPMFERLLTYLEEKTGARVVKQWAA